MHAELNSPKETDHRVEGYIPSGISIVNFYGVVVVWLTDIIKVPAERNVPSEDLGLEGAESTQTSCWPDEYKWFCP